MRLADWESRWMFMWVWRCARRGGDGRQERTNAQPSLTSRAAQAHDGSHHTRDWIRHNSLASHAIGFPYEAGDHDGLASHAIGLYTSDRGLHMPRARRPPSRLSRTGPLAMPT